MKRRQDAPAKFTHLGPLPVRVRTSSGEIVGSGVTGASIELPDKGDHFVTMVLPDGQEIAVEDAMPSGSDDLPTGLIADAVPNDVVAEAVTLSAGLWHGKWLDLWRSGRPSLTGASSGEIELSSQSPVTISHRADGDQLLLTRQADRLLCTVVPYDFCGSCSAGTDPACEIAALLLDKPDEPVIAFRSQVSEEANTLLSFVELGVLTNMVALSEDEILRGEQAVQGSATSALRAITGAYVLLRSNLLHGLGPWLNQLEPFAKWLPDLQPLQAELAARDGDHERAVERIDAWIEEGRCPWFRGGLSYLSERIKLYLDVTDNKAADFNLDARRYARFRAMNQLLERMLATMVTSRYITTFELPLETG